LICTTFKCLLALKVATRCKKYGIAVEPNFPFAPIGCFSRSLQSLNQSNMNNDSNSEVHPAACKKVILVEDNKAEADLTRIIYMEQSIPCEIIHCKNGEEFLTLLTSINQNDISYVLLDLNMPRVSGYDVLTILSESEEWKNLIVIVFSSSSNSNDISKCYELGAKAYVAKPLDLAELDRTILSIHHFWGNSNVRPQHLN
jgi:CheY-like chemotaxis protein